MSNREPSLCFVSANDKSAGKADASEIWFGFAAQGLGAATCTAREAMLGEEPDCDVYVVNRALWDVPLTRWTNRNKRVFVWIDDAFTYLPPISQIYTNWQTLMPEFKRLLARVDGLIAPNPFLAADWSGLCAATYFIPNYHAIEPPMREARRDCLTLGWGGSTNHLTSWRDTQAFRYIPPEFQVRIVSNALIGSLIEPYNFVENIGHLPYPDYLAEMASWDVCLIPVHGEYDRRRSWIKALECCLVGTPWVAVGDAIDIYRQVPGGARLLDPTTIPQGIEDAMRADLGVNLEWALRQHIRYHLAEWRNVLFS